MSAVEAIGYQVRESSDALKHAGLPFKVCRDGVAVDAFRTRCGAEYAARLLNDGLATVDPHGLISCRVVAS